MAQWHVDLSRIIWAESTEGQSKGHRGSGLQTNRSTQKHTEKRTQLSYLCTSIDHWSPVEILLIRNNWLGHVFQRQKVNTGTHKVMSRVKWSIFTHTGESRLSAFNTQKFRASIDSVVKIIYQKVRGSNCNMLPLLGPWSVSDPTFCPRPSGDT